MKSIMIFDTETTDLIKTVAVPIANQPEIIELYSASYMLNNNDWKEGEAYHKLFQPKKPISREITSITSITNADVANAPTFREEAKKIASFIAKHDTVVAHNLSFDMDMVNIEMERAGVKVEWPRHRICTVEATEHIKGHRLSLTDLHQYLFGEPFEGAHRADVDVKALVRCVIKLYEDGEI